MATQPWLGTASLLILLAAYFPPITYAATKDASDPQLVRLRYLQGDVRFNRGDGKHPDLKRPWEVAIANLPIEQNYALVTGDGRAEIEFEDGSEVYVAENTVLLFTELTSANDVPTTKLELVSGTVTAGLQPLQGEFFEIDTPTGQVESSFPQRSFVRIDAYLDGMELTPQMDTATEFDNHGERTLLTKGQTVTFSDGAAPRAAKPSEFRASDDFDKWAGARYQARTVTMAAALKASGLTSPVVGLPDMYENGTFTSCPPYGMCWEPKQDAKATPQSSQLQAPAQGPRKTRPKRAWCSPLRNPAGKTPHQPLPQAAGRRPEIHSKLKPFGFIRSTPLAHFLCGWIGPKWRTHPKNCRNCKRLLESSHGSSRCATTRVGCIKARVFDP